MSNWDELAGLAQAMRTHNRRDAFLQGRRAGGAQVTAAEVIESGRESARATEAFWKAFYSLAGEVSDENAPVYPDQSEHLAQMYGGPADWYRDEVAPASWGVR